MKRMKERGTPNKAYATPYEVVQQIQEGLASPSFSRVGSRSLPLDHSFVRPILLPSGSASPRCYSKRFY